MKMTVEIPKVNWVIILDSCRYDRFKNIIREFEFKGELEKFSSKVSCTFAFLKKLAPFPNSIVVTGHPFIFKFKHKFTKVLDAGFNYDLSTCPPEYVVTKVYQNISLIRKFKHKILWFLQPHHPYIGKTKLRVPIYQDGVAKKLTPEQKQIAMLKKAKEKGILLQAYDDNLRHVLKCLLKLKPVLNGEIVITSDHGEGLGLPYHPSEKPVYSHPCGVMTSELTLIPRFKLLKTTF